MRLIVYEYPYNLVYVYRLKEIEQYLEINCITINVFHGNFLTLEAGDHFEPNS